MPFVTIAASFLFLAVRPGFHFNVSGSLQSLLMKQKRYLSRAGHALCTYVAVIDQRLTGLNLVLVLSFARMMRWPTVVVNLRRAARIQDFNSIFSGANQHVQNTSAKHMTNKQQTQTLHVLCQLTPHHPWPFLGSPAVPWVMSGKQDLNK